MKGCVLALLLSCAASTSDVNKNQVVLKSDGVMPVPMAMYRSDCGKKRPVSLMQKAHNPGAGLSAVEPYSTVFMDGFMMIACFKDYMYENGDKFGNNKYVYEVGASHNVSIVHYTEVVPREDQKSMTHEVCFEFCRTVPEMMFFGITQGRDCYCAPFVEQMAGDSSNCDAVCEGDSSRMCGGMKKSSIFSMHKCDDAAGNLIEAAESLSDAVRDLMDIGGEVNEIAVSGQSAAAGLQERLGQAGDPVASDLMQSAKVFAGELEHPASEALEWVKTAAALKGEALAAGRTVEAGSFESASAAEDLTQQCQTALAEAEEKTEQLSELKQSAQPSYPDLEGAPNSTAQYLPLMYFVDKEFEGVPSTCGGDTVKKPLFGLSKDECGRACDAAIHSCVGFSFFPEGVCFLFSKFKSVTYFTGCDSTGFLQKAKSKKDGEMVGECVAKLSSFEGTTLKPDPSGKCDQCLKSATKAERCF